jgi:hypothetical protein
MQLYIGELHTRQRQNKCKALGGVMTRAIEEAGRLEQNGEEESSQRGQAQGWPIWVGPN